MSSFSQHDGHLPSEALDRMVLAILSPSEREGAEAHLQGCDRCRSALQTLKADCNQFERDVLPRTLGKVRQRLDQAPRFGLSWFSLNQLWPAMGLAAMAAAVLLVLPRGSRPQDSYDIGVKGGPSVQVFGMHDGAVRMLGTGSRVAVGDRLRFVVESSGYEYLLITSIDGEGHVSAFFPFNGAASASIPQGRYEAPGSVELDGAKGPERLFGYFSHQPVDLEAVRSSLRVDPERPPRLSGAAPPVVVRLEKDVP